jgi:hypothetical protein
MKAILTSFVVCLAFTSVFCQGNVKLTIGVVSPENKPLPNINITAIETSNLSVIRAKTNNEGKIVLELTNGVTWAISIGVIENCMHVSAQANRITTTTRFFVYDPAEYARKKKQDKNRTNANFKIVGQSYEEGADFPEGNCAIAIKLQQPDGKLLPDITVDAVDVKQSLIHRGKTNANGVAYLVLPNKTNYDIDVNHLKNFSYADFGDEYRVHNLTLVFAPTIVKEKVVNDTTYQETDAMAKPSTERALIRVTVKGGKRNGLLERVYARQLPSGKVYQAKTNDKGVAYLLIPTKFVYMIDLDYQKDVDAVNLLYATELTSGNMTVTYRPDPRFENPESFIPTPDRLIVKKFSDFLQKQFTKPVDKPFNLEIKSLFKIHKQSREALFMLTLAGAEQYGNVRLPLNAALVLDKSGSMYSSGRYEAVKTTLADLANSFTNKDIISVVLFDDNAVEVQHSAADHKAGLEKIASYYSPGGGTNILGGLERGAESIAKNFDRNRANKIILLTDGYGDNEPEKITDFVAAKFAQGVEFSAIGLGRDFNHSLLELIARKGNGTFSFADESVALSETFLKEVKNSFNYSASNLKVEVYHNKKLLFSNLYGYPVTGQTDESVTFEIGKVPSGTNEIAFLKFKLDKPSQDLESSPLIVKVSYFDLAKNQPVSYEQQIKMEWTNETDTQLIADQEEKKLYAIAVLNQSLKLMAEAYEKHDHAAAVAALKDGKAQIHDLFPDARPKEIKQLYEEIDKYLQLFFQVQKNESKAQN